MRYARLLCISDANHNKYYEMNERPGGTFEVQYGRVGAAPQTRAYPMRDWEAKRGEKLRKGYRDVTELSVVADDRPRYLRLSDPDVAALIDRLERAAQSSIGAHYDVQVAAVTQPMLAAADATLARLAALAAQPTLPVGPANEALMDLYHTIPRKMTNVAANLVADRDGLRRRLADEQELLDTLRTQVVLAAPDGSPAPTETILDALGLSLRLATDLEASLVRSYVPEGQRGRIRRVFSARHAATADRFEQHVAAAADSTSGLFWHGSRTENWLSIFRTGLVLHPTSAVITGKMFGHGLYFADRFEKSLGYTSLSGSRWAAGAEPTAFLALFRVHTGHRFAVKAWKPEHTSYTRAKLPRRYDSLHAKGGVDLRHDEFIVYNEAQATLAYLVEVAL